MGRQPAGLSPQLHRRRHQAGGPRLGAARPGRRLPTRGRTRRRGLAEGHPPEIRSAAFARISRSFTCCCGESPVRGRWHETDCPAPPVLAGGRKHLSYNQPFSWPRRGFPGGLDRCSRPNLENSGRGREFSPQLVGGYYVYSVQLLDLDLLVRRPVVYASVWITLSGRLCVCLGSVSPVVYALTNRGIHWQPVDRQSGTVSPSVTLWTRSARRSGVARDSRAACGN